MTGIQIGDVPISTVQNVEVDSSTETEEIDLIGEDVQLVFTGADDAEQIVIEFTAVEQIHPEGASVEEQRSDLKELVSNDAVENSVRYNDLEGHISVEDVSIPVEDNGVIIKGEIQGKFLPWPKHFPDEKPTFTKRVGGDLTYILDVKASINSVLSIDGDIHFVLDTIGDADTDVTEGSGEVLYRLDVSGASNLFVSTESDVLYSLDVDAERNVIRSIDSFTDYTLDLSSYAAIDGELNGRLGEFRLGETKLGEVK